MNPFPLYRPHPHPNLDHRSEEIERFERRIQVIGEKDQKERKRKRKKGR
jgi:hypothetical protein